MSRTVGTRKRVLVAAPWIPDPSVPSGSMLRTTALIDALRSRFDVEVVGYTERGAHRPRGRRSSLLNSLATRRAYQISKWDTPFMRAEFADALRRFRPDAVHIDHTQMAPLAFGLPGPKLLDMTNVESAFAEGVAATSRGPVRWLAARDGRLLRSVEARAAAEFDAVIVSSAAEAARAPAGAEVIPNGIDPSREPIRGPIDQDRLCFVGLFSWLPNIDGAIWLVREVVPLLPPSLRVQLVGRDPDKRVLDLAGPRVEVTGEVPDAWPYVCSAAVVLAPLRSTGGTRLKILEGMLSERPVLATSAAAGGFEELFGRGLLIADDPTRFATLASELAADPARAAELGREGRRAVVESFDWASIGTRLLDIYEARLGIS